MDLRTELEKWVEEHENTMEMVQIALYGNPIALEHHRAKAEMAKTMIAQIKGILALSGTETEA